VATKGSETGGGKVLFAAEGMRSYTTESLLASRRKIQQGHVFGEPAFQRGFRPESCSRKKGQP
jgi:hypothetical protein